MKMWITLAIVAVMLIITSATIFLLPKNDEINEFYNQESNSGDEIISENEQRGDISGDEIITDTEILNNYSGESSGEILNDIEIANSGEKARTETIVNISNKNNVQNNIVHKSDTVKTEHIEVTKPVIQEVQTEVVEQPIQVEQKTEEPIVEEPTIPDIVENVEVPENIETVINNVVIPNDAVGMLNIPKISVNRPILEGHSLDILKNGLGHVLETAYWQGNIGILGHNGGNAGYFKDLTKLVIGDTISYTTEYGTRNYKVTEIVQIDDTDWSYLANTKDNRITLITCVKNVPEKRLCIQATEIF